METLWQDLYYGFRVLAKKPAFTAVAILSLAIGIGANSAIFSVTNALLLRPLPYKDADQLVILWNRSPGLNIEQDWFSLGQYMDIKIENHVFEDVALTLGGSFNMTGHGVPEHIEGAWVSSSLFPLLGVRATHGRFFLPEDNAQGKPQAVILSHGFWQRRFGSDPEAIGKKLILSDQSLTIVGVIEPEFSLSKEIMPTVNGIQKADVLLPFQVTESDRTKRGGEDFNIFARLKPGVTVAQAQAEMDTIAEQMKQQYPENYPPNGQLTISVVPLLEQVVGDIRLALYVLLGSVGLVLLIACANVANLLLARAAARQKEMAIRAAVGASRLRILRQLLTESVLLALAGGLMGLIIALLAIEFLRAYGPENVPRLDEISIDGRVLSFTFFVSLLTGILFGLVPALKASRINLNETLKDGGRSSSGTSHHRVRNLLVVSEVALSLVVLISAGLLIRSYQRVQDASPGFNPSGVLSLRLSLPVSRYSNQDSVFAFYKQLTDRVMTLPGIESAGTSYFLPLSANAVGWEPIAVEGYVPRAGEDLIISNTGIVSVDYLQTMGMPLLKGRYFNEHDKKGAHEVVIINQGLADRFWPNEDPLGKRLQRAKTGPWRVVVGVVNDQKEFTVEKEPPMTVFYPMDQFIPRGRYLVARTSSDPVRLTTAVTEEIRALDAELPVYDVNTMEQRVYDSLARRRFSMLLLVVFACFALTLAAIGIYGVMTYWVNQRTQEIGIRMALGAGQGKILKLVIRQALVLASIGIVAGLAIALVSTQVMSSLLFGTSATDLLTFVLISLLLGGIALLASYLPARRAARVDPIVALRYE